MSIIKLMTDDYNKVDDLERVINYVLRNKEQDEECVFWTGLGVNTDSAENVISDMRTVKRFHNKTDGKQLWHLVVNIYRYKSVQSRKEYLAKRETELSYCRLIGYDVCSLIFNKGFQNVFAIHEDSEYLHLHFVINSVSYINGNHIRNAFSFEKELQSYLKDNYQNLQWRSKW